VRLARRNLVLTGTLAALLAANLLLDAGAGRVPLPERLFPEGLPERATSLTVAAGDDTLTLTRTSAGWGIATLEGFPALDWVVADQLRRLGGLTSADLVAAEPDAAAIYGFDGDTRRVTVRDGAGRVLVEADQARGEGPGTWLRPAGTTRVYRAPALGLFDPEPSRWFDPHLVVLGGEPVRGLAWTGAEGERRVTRDDQGRWITDAGAQVSGATVDALLATLRNLLFTEVAAARGDAPALAVRLLDGDGRELARLDFGAPEGDAVPARADRFEGRFEVRIAATGFERVRAALASLAR